MTIVHTKSGCDRAQGRSRHDRDREFPIGFGHPRLEANKDPGRRTASAEMPIGCQRSSKVPFLLLRGAGRWNGT